jgi:hypothetical protein
MQNKNCILPSIALLSALIFCNGCDDSPDRDFVTWEQYSSDSAGNDSEKPSLPIILRLHGGKGDLLYLGVEHTACAQHPSLMQIERAWNDFHPTLAFSEGGVWPLGASREEAIRRYGEGGLIRYLAARDSIPIRSLEPKRADEVRSLRRYFTAEEIKLYYALRNIPQCGKSCNAEIRLEDYLTGTLNCINHVRRLRGAPRNIAELESSVHRLLPDLDDWRKIPAEWFDPAQDHTFLNQIARRSAEIRDRHMIKQLAATVRRGDRVFAVAGFHHVEMQKKALVKQVEKSAPLFTAF